MDSKKFSNDENVRKIKDVLEVDVRLTLLKMEGFVELLELQLSNHQKNLQMDTTLNVLKKGIKQVGVCNNEILNLLEKIQS